MRLVEITPEQLAARAAIRPAGYLEELEPALIRAAGKLFVDMDHPARQALKQQIPSAAVSQAIVAATDQSHWPRGIRLLAKLRRPSDAGMGDIIHRLAVRIGADRLAKLAARITGLDCGCGDRRALLNLRFPFDRRDIEA